MNQVKHHVYHGSAFNENVYPGIYAVVTRQRATTYWCMSESYTEAWVANGVVVHLLKKAMR